MRAELGGFKIETNVPVTLLDASAAEEKAALDKIFVSGLKTIFIAASMVVISLCVMGFWVAALPSVFFILADIVIAVIFFRSARAFPVLLQLELTLIMLLPLMTQALMGGFVSSGGFGLWAMLAPMSAVVHKTSYRITNLAVFILLETLSIVIGSHWGIPGLQLTGLTAQIFIASNLVVISIYLFYRQGQVISLQQGIRARLKEAYQEVQNLSLKDTLTGLYNRRGLNLLAEQYLKLGRAEGVKTLVFFGDIDGLKVINDQWGHAQGDEAIIRTARILQETFGETALVARFGGDEFTVVLRHSDGVAAEGFMVLIGRKLKEYNEGSKKQYHLGISLGYSLLSPDDPRTLDEILLESDQRLYKQKQISHQKPSLIDSLTGLYNSRGLNQMANQYLQRERAEGMMTLILFGDVEGLKAINDRWGHEEGDEVILQAARVLQETFGETALLARFGGGEFTVVRPRCGPEEAEDLIVAIGRKAEDANTVSKKSYRFGIRLDYSLIPSDDRRTFEEILQASNRLSVTDTVS